jgi:hypothetical protein
MLPFNVLMIKVLTGSFGQLLADMKLSKRKLVPQETTTPRKRKVDVSDIVVTRGVRPRMENMSIGGEEGGIGGGESSKMML